MRWIIVLGIGALVACTDVVPIPTTSITVSGPSQGGPVTVWVDGPSECPRAWEWELVTWPEMELVAATIGATEQIESVCTLPIVPDAPLTERWYAAHWRGELLPYEQAWGSLQLRDGSRVWRFQGVTPAVVTEIVTIPWEGRMFLVARVSEQIDPAPGYDWGSMMTTTQGEIACTYPGPEVYEGGNGIGFFETLVVECEGVDWNAPVHIHIEGAVARYGSQAPVPVVDVDHTFGVSTDSVVLRLAEAETPPSAPPELCDTPDCS